MRRAWCAVALLFLGPLLAGCLDSGGQDLKSSVRSHIQAVIDGDLDRFFSYFGYPFQELNGRSYTREEHRASVEEWWAQGRHRFQPGDRPETFLDMESAQYLSYEQYEDRIPSWGGFQPQGGDVLVDIQEYENSRLDTDWDGVYRHVGSRWVMVAG